MEAHIERMQTQIDKLEREAESLRTENLLLKAEVNALLIAGGKLAKYPVEIIVRSTDAHQPPQEQTVQMPPAPATGGQTP
jgi:hypothetical protein